MRNKCIYLEVRVIVEMEKRSSHFGPVKTEETLLGVRCCVRLHVAWCMLLRVVGSRCVKFETGQTFQPTTPNISFVP